MVVRKSRPEGQDIHDGLRIAQQLAGKGTDETRGPQVKHGMLGTEGQYLS